jgi:hypothetical protein
MDLELEGRVPPGERVEVHEVDLGLDLTNPAMQLLDNLYKSTAIAHLGIPVSR